jgi:hypothetical protein
MLHPGTSKHYSDYSLTNLGYDQAFNVGGFYRDNYIVDGAPRKILGISPEAYTTSQLYAAAPDQQVMWHLLNKQKFKSKATADSSENYNCLSSRAVPSAPRH